MLGGSCERGTVMALKSERLEPRSMGSTSMGTPPVSDSMADGGLDWSIGMGFPVEPPTVVLGVETGCGLLSTELLNVRLTGGGEVMLKMSGDMGVVWASIVAGEAGGGEVFPVAIGSSFSIFMLAAQATEVVMGGEAMEVALGGEAMDCAAESPGSFLICTAGGGVGLGPGMGGLGEGFFEPNGDLVIMLCGVPPADTSV